MGSAIGGILGSVGGSFLPIPGGSAIGGALGSAFGSAISGGGDPSQGTPATANNTVNLPSWLSDPYQSQVSQAQSLAQTPYNPQMNYQVAGFTPQQQQAFGLTNNLVGQYQQPYNTALGNTQALGQQAMGGLNNQQFQSYMNPYIQNVLDTSKQQAFQNYDMAQNRLSEQAAGQGAFGNSRVGLAQGQLGSNFIRDLNAQQASTLAGGFNTALGGYQTGINQGLNAANQMGSLATNQQNAGLAGINALYGMGAAQQGLAQQQLTAQQQNAQQQAQYPWQQLYNAQGVMSTPSQIYGHQQTSTQTLQQPSALSQGLGIGSALSGLGVGNSGSAAGLGSYSPFFGINSGNYQSANLAGNGNAAYDSLSSSDNGGFLSSVGNFFGGLFNEGGVVPGYKKGGQVNPAQLGNGMRVGGLLAKSPSIGDSLGTNTGRGMHLRREYGINGSYDEGGSVDPISVGLTDPSKLDTLGTAIAFKKANNYVNQLLGISSDTSAPDGYARGGIVGYADGGSPSDEYTREAFRAFTQGQDFDLSGVPYNNDTTKMINALNLRYPGRATLPDVNQYTGTNNMPNLSRPTYNGYYRQHPDEDLNRQMLGQELRKGGIAGYADGGDVSYGQEFANYLVNNHPEVADSISSIADAYKRTGIAQGIMTPAYDDPNSYIGQHPISGTIAAAMLPIAATGEAALAGGSALTSSAGRAIIGGAGAYPAAARALIGAGALIGPQISDNIAKAGDKAASSKIGRLKEAASAEDMAIQQAGLSKADQTYLDNLHAIAGQQQAQTKPEQGPTGPFGSPLNLPALALGQGMLSAYAGHGNFAADLAGGAGNVGEEYYKQKQLEAMYGYKNAMAEAAQARGQSELGNLQLKQQDAPYRMALQQAQVAAANVKAQGGTLEQQAQNWARVMVPAMPQLLTMKPEQIQQVFMNMASSSGSGQQPMMNPSSSLSGYTTAQLQAMRKQ